VGGRRSSYKYLAPFDVYVVRKMHLHLNLQKWCPYRPWTISQFELMGLDRACAWPWGLQPCQLAVAPVTVVVLFRKVQVVELVAMIGARHDEGLDMGRRKQGQHWKMWRSGKVEKHRKKS
jgi:hypothetical protein